MPTPVGHALGGLIVGLALRPRSPAATSVPGADLRPHEAPPSPAVTSVPRRARRGLGWTTDLKICALAACLPDLDVLWGRHNMETHSVGFAVLVGLAILVLAPRIGRPLPGYSMSRVRLAVACTLAVMSHVLFDWLGSDDMPPLGVMAFWPATNQFYFADAFVFEAISRRYWLPGFIQHNALAVVRETAILAPVAGALWMWRRPKSRT